MAVRSLKSDKVHVWKPPIYSANFRVTVERSDASVDDITDILIGFKIEDGVTEGIGNFEFKIPNPNETYTTAWTGMEIFRFYCDYEKGTPTTLRFRGRIEKKSTQDVGMIVCTGRSEALFVHDQNVNKAYSNSDAGYAIKDLFDTYCGGRFDTSGIDISTGKLITLTFTDVPFWDAVEEICQAAEYDCYVAADLTVKFFAQGSQLNTEEGIVHDHNLINVGDFAEDLTFIKNQIRVKGGIVDGVQVIYTANDTAANQTKYGIRRLNVDEDSIITFASAKDYAEALLTRLKNPPVVGEVKGVMIASIQPGENIRLSSPLENLPPDNYRTTVYKHELDEIGLFTTVTVNKQPKKLSHILKDRIQTESKRSKSAENPNDLNFAEIELYNSDVGSHSDTEISDGVLKLTHGSTTGTWTSQTFTTADNNNVSQIRISLVGDNLPGVRIDVSANGGTSYTTVTRDELLTIGATGKSIKVKLTLSSTAQVDSLKIQYSTT